MTGSSTPRFRADAGWLSHHAAPHKPKFQPPPGAVDAHCHVFGPGDVFPYAPERKYTPTRRAQGKALCAARLPGLRTQRDRAGHLPWRRQSRAGGCAAQLCRSRARRGDREARSHRCASCAQLHDAGVRGVRFNFVKRLVDVTPTDVLHDIARRIAPLGWHVVVYFEAADLPELEPFLASLPTRVVVDHMGRPDVRQPVTAPSSSASCASCSEHDHVWSKVSGAERLSMTGPPNYRDFVPFARRIVETFPDRVLWGTDWPHPNMKSHMPDDGDLVDLLPHIAPTADLQRRLLVDNPMRLYWES